MPRETVNEAAHSSKKMGAALLTCSYEKRFLEICSKFTGEHPC